MTVTTPAPASTGTQLIAEERARQITEEGWTPEHDAEHDGGELIDAARSYALAAMASYYGDTNVTFADIRAGHPAGDWPWDAAWWKPSGDPVRNLVKAGALIAAEIDRLLAVRDAAAVEQLLVDDHKPDDPDDPTWCATCTTPVEWHGDRCGRWCETNTPVVWCGDCIAAAT